MKTYSRWIAVVLTLCLFIAVFSGCGQGEKAAQTSAVTATEPSAASDGHLQAIAAMTEQAAQAEGFNHNIDLKGSGSIDGFSIAFESGYSRQQPADSDDLHVWHLSSAETADDFFYESCDAYYTGGVYYSADTENLYICSEETIAPVEIPGKLFLDVMAKTEMTDVDPEALSCAFTLSGSELKAVIADLCPNISSELSSSADWSDISADFFVDFSEYNYYEDIQISSPSLGAQLLRDVKKQSAAECTEFTLDLNIDYKSTFVDTPYKPEDAVEGAPAQLMGLNRVLKQVLGEQEESLEIAAEQEAAENFTSVEIVDHESELPGFFETEPAATEPAATETQHTEPAAAEPQSTTPVVTPENGVTLTTDGKSVVFTIPTEIRHYYKIRQDTPTIAVMVHDIFTSVGGRTIVEFLRGTPEEYIAYRQKDPAQAETVTIDGRQVLLWKQKQVIEVEKATTKYEDEYVFATAIGNTVLGFCVDVSYDANSKCEIDDSIVQILLSHCIIG